ncbi:MAG TPA: outer membrane protein [Pseudolabrys sp.]|nr:outer membrane protein [Pseudolabrys sp.]
MKRISLAAALAVLSFSAANAADLGRRPAAMPTKAPAYVSPLYNWSGLYAGLNGGGAWGRSSVTGPLSTGGNFRNSGGFIGGTLGYNYQINQTVLGLETDLDWSNIKGSAACAVGVSCEVKNTWLGTVRGRVGYAMGASGTILPYFTGGLAYGGVKTSADGLGSTSSTKAGWTLGGGVEAAISGPWTAKIEYLYVDLQNTGAPAGSTSRFRTNEVRGGINYRF